MAYPFGHVSNSLQLEKSGISVCEIPSPGREMRSMHLIPRFRPPEGSYPTVPGGLQIIPGGQVKFAPSVVVLSTIRNSERYLAEFKNLPSGQLFLLFHPNPKTEPPPALVIFFATLDVTTPVDAKGLW